VTRNIRIKAPIFKVLMETFPVAAFEATTDYLDLFHVKQSEVSSF
jgi:hypothetical protein